MSATDDRSGFGKRQPMDVTQRRLHDRHTIGRPAFFETEHGKTPCHVTNLSEGGAMLDVGSAELPQMFNVLFSGRVHGCKLIWRNGTSAGVEFRTALTEAELRTPTLSVRSLRKELFGRTVLK